MSGWDVLLPLCAPVLLIAVRCYGLACTAPLLGSALITQRLRVAMAVLFGVCGYGVATSTPAAGLPAAALVWHVPLEFALGAALGCGARLLLAGLELAAGLIDAQAGLAVGSVLHPEAAGETSVSGAWLVLLGGMTWLTLAPVGGDVRIFAAWLDTLRTIPPGALTQLDAPVQLVHDVILSSLVLGVQVAAPVLVTAGLLQTVWAALARSQGGALWQPALAPVRVVVCLLVLALTATELGERVASGVDGLLRGVGTSLSASAGAGAR